MAEVKDYSAEALLAKEKEVEECINFSRVITDE